MDAEMIFVISSLIIGSMIYFIGGTLCRKSRELKEPSAAENSWFNKMVAYCVQNQNIEISSKTWNAMTKIFVRRSEYYLNVHFIFKGVDAALREYINWERKLYRHPYYVAEIKNSMHANKYQRLYI